MAVFDAHSNLSISTVVTPPSPATTGISLSIVAGHGTARFTGVPPYNVTVQLPGVLPDHTNAEVCRVTARVGDVFTLVRAQEGTIARAILPGDLIYLSITAKVLTDIEQAITTGPPALHAPTHGIGGTDPVAVTGLAGYPGGTATFLRADGTFVAPPTGGIPSAHHATHEPGGSDALVALDAGTVTTGTLSDARLSANVARRDQANTYTGLGDVQRIATVSPKWQLHRTDLAANSRLWSSHIGALTELQVEPLTDAGGFSGGPVLSLERAGVARVRGAVYERARTAAIGEWTNIPNTPGNFVAQGGLGGTLVVANYYNQAYTRIGQTAFYAFYLNLTVTGSPRELVISYVPGIITAVASGSTFVYGTATGFVNSLAADQGLRLHVNATGLTDWTAGTYFMIGVLPVQIQ